MTDFNIDKVKICSISEIKEEKILDFFRRSFPKRVPRLYKIWKWINRVSYTDEKTPFIICYEDKVISFAGLIPFRININGKNYSASWCIDFATLPEYRKKGLGTTITKRWMEFSDVGFEITHNENSGPIFKKLGWSEVVYSYMHYIILNPLFHFRYKNIPNVIKNPINFFINRFYYFLYSKKQINNGSFKYENVNNCNIKNFIIEKSTDEGDVITVRDYEYIKWRILESPDSDKYLYLKYENINILIKKYFSSNLNYLDILIIQGYNNNYEILLGVLSKLAVDFMKEKFVFIRLYTNNSKLNNILKNELKTFSKQPGFMYYSKNEDLLNNLKNAKWNWQLIDNDFERFEE